MTDAKTAQSAPEDQLELITENKRFGDIPLSNGLYFALRLGPVLLCLILGLAHASFVLSATTVLIIAGADFWLTKNHFGLGLVGLRWSFDKTETPEFPHISCYSRPFPFVASTFDSNIFWLGLLCAAVLDVIITIVFLVDSPKWFIITLILLALNAFNFYGFMRCHAVSKTQADNAARTLLLDTSVTMFQAANEAKENEPTTDESDLEEEKAESIDDQKDPEEEEMEIE